MPLFYIYPQTGQPGFIAKPMPLIARLHASVSVSKFFVIWKLQIRHPALGNLSSRLTLSGLPGSINAWT
jgi:hypothetical protein